MLDRGHPRETLNKPSWFELNSFDQSSEPVDADIVDVSSAGACIQSNKVLDPGRVITLWMDLKHTDVQVPCIAEVRWSKAVNNQFKMGLQFLK
ncbi:MAG: PilZ domain-containing protein [Thermodesulfobacteriota bacterium]